MASARRGSTGAGGEARQELRRAAPRWPARFVASWQWTLLALAGGMGLLAGCLAWQDVQQGDAVPGSLWATLAAALAVAAVTGIARLLLGDEVREAQRRSHALRECRFLLKETKRALTHHSGDLKEGQAEELHDAAEALAAARDAGDYDGMQEGVSRLDERLGRYLAPYRKSSTREYIESIAIALGIALVLRAFVFEAFKIPSGSMIPTLQVGDHIFVNKFIYGIRIPYTDLKLGMELRKPRRGEIVVFKNPKNEDEDYIKRIIGIPGDTIELKNNVVYINGKAVERKHVAGTCSYDDFIDDQWVHMNCDAWTETLDGHNYTTYYKPPPNDLGPESNYGPITVPPRSLFVMGDARNNSNDSRYWRFVPYNLLKGKAMVIWMSWGRGIRYDRVGKILR